MKNQLASLRQLAESTALLAGRQLKTNQPDWGKIIAEQGRDVKVKADKLAEEIILTQLKAATHFSILTEETGWHGRENTEESVWVIDPLDGSFNYHQNIPFCCVAIALVINGEPIIGVIYDFNHDEVFSGTIGEGAWLNGERIEVSKISSPANAVLNTGFPSRVNYEDALETWKRGQKFRKVRMLGSAALSLAYVASSRAEVYQEQGTMFWDVAAGCALVKAAGGIYKLKGDIFTSPLDAFASNGKLTSLTHYQEPINH